MIYCSLSQSEATALGIPKGDACYQRDARKNPFFILYAAELQDLHQPQPLLHKKGLQTTPQTPRQSLARGLVDSESWLSPSKFWYGSRAFALRLRSGFAMFFLTPTTLNASRRGSSSKTFRTRRSLEECKSFES